MPMKLNVVFVCLLHAKCCTDKPAMVAKPMPLKSSRLPPPCNNSNSKAAVNEQTVGNSGNGQLEETPSGTIIKTKAATIATAEAAAAAAQPSLTSHDQRAKPSCKLSDLPPLLLHVARTVAVLFLVLDCLKRSA